MEEEEKMKGERRGDRRKGRGRRKEDRGGRKGRGRGKDETDMTQQETSGWKKGAAGTAQ